MQPHFQIFPLVLKMSFYSVLNQDPNKIPVLDFFDISLKFLLINNSTIPFSLYYPIRPIF